MAYQELATGFACMVGPLLGGTSYDFLGFFWTFAGFFFFFFCQEMKLIIMVKFRF